MKPKNFLRCTGHAGVTFKIETHIRKGEFLTLVIFVCGTDITREMCLGEHVPQGSKYPSNTGLKYISRHMLLFGT